MDYYQLECRFLTAHEELVRAAADSEDLQVSYDAVREREEKLREEVTTLERTELELECAMAINFEAESRVCQTFDDTAEDLFNAKNTLEALELDASIAFEDLTRSLTRVDEKRSACNALRKELISIKVKTEPWTKP